MAPQASRALGVRAGVGATGSSAGAGAGKGGGSLAHTFLMQGDGEVYEVTTGAGSI